MSNYKIVKNAAGVMTAYGPNTGDYEPTLQDGETLTIVTQEVANGLIADSQAAQATAAQNEATIKASICTKMSALTYTPLNAAEVAFLAKAMQ